MADKIEDEKRMEYGSEEKAIGLSSEPSPTVEPTKDGLRTVDAGLPPDQVVTEDEVSQAEARRIMKKIDYRIIPLLSVLYL
jgi:hypothetical protein